MCLNCFQPRPGLGPQYVGPGPAYVEAWSAGCGPGRAGLGPKKIISSDITEFKPGTLTSLLVEHVDF